jgi:ATP-dependent Clp protease ATP-binding subunit ClpX
MYEIPSLDGIQKCIIDADVINGRRRPLLVAVGEETPREYQESA